MAVVSVGLHYGHGTPFFSEKCSLQKPKISDPRTRPRTDGPSSLQQGPVPADLAVPCARCGPRPVLSQRGPRSLPCGGAGPRSVPPPRLECSADGAGSIASIPTRITEPWGEQTEVVLPITLALGCGCSVCGLGWLWV